MMWPLLLDYSRDECKRILRKLELEAYAAVVSAFRAQGDLSKDKKSILQELCSCLSISLERHRAEIRRSVNDEKLNTIADRMAGPNTSTEWAIEGRRLIPLMPRLVPQTAFTAIANNAANIQAAKNAAMPAPSATGLKDGDRQINTVGSAPPTPTRTPVQLMRPPSGPSPVPANSQHPISPGSNSVLVLPSGMSIHIKGGEGNEDEANNNRKRKRSSSFDSISSNPQKVMVTPNVMGHSAATAGGNLPSSAMRVTLPGSLAKSTATVAGPQGSKQVILLSGSNSNLSPSILHRCLSVPVVKTVATTTNNVVASQTKATVSTTYSTIAPPGSNTMPAFPASGQSGLITTNASSGGSMVVYASARPRPKTLPVPRQVMRPRSSVMVSPNAPAAIGAASPQFPSPRMQTPGVRPYVRTPVQYRQQDIGGGVKIITQSIPSSTSRLLPKPANNSLIVVTSASLVGQRQCTTITGSGNQSTPRIVNVMSVAPQTRMPLRPQPVAGQVATTGKVSPSPRHGTPSKPNVIVVHKAQTWPTPQNQGTAYVVSTPSQYPRVSEAVTYVQRQEKSKQGGMVTVVKTVAPPRIGGGAAVTNSSIAIPTSAAVVATTTTTTTLSEIVPVTTSQSEISLAELQAAENHKNSLLADLIQAAGIVPESKASATTISVSKTTQSVVATPRIPTPPLPAPLATSEVVALDNTMVIEGDITDSSELLQFTEILAQNQSEGKDGMQELPLDTGSEVSIQEIDLPLDQLQEGQVLEIQAQDASVLLNQSGQLTKEVLDLLQQAGIQINQDDVQVTTSIGSPKSIEHDLSKASEELQEQQGSLVFLPDKLGEDTLVTSTDNLPSIVEVFSTALPDDFQTVHIVEDVITSREANNGPVVETLEMSKTSARNTTHVQGIKQVPAVSGGPFHQQQPAETDVPKENYLAGSVLVESSELDTTGMKLEDFTSQRVDSGEFTGDTIDFNL